MSSTRADPSPGPEPGPNPGPGPATDVPPDRQGRRATQPLAIPARGWKDILLRVYRSTNENRILLVAAGTTFYLLLAMVPALTALVSTYGLFNDRASVVEQLAFVQPYLPEGGQAILEEQLGRLASQDQARLGFALIASLGIALWSTSSGMKALIEAMNVAYAEREERSFVRLTLISLALTTGGVLMLLLLIAVMVVMPIVLGWLRLPIATGFWVQAGGASMLAITGLAALSALYRWAPSRAQARWRWITPGALAALVAGFLASTLFGWYVANFGRYNETYGSLGAMIGFMTWLWIMVIFVITGAELNAEMEHQTTRDSTTGTELPLGARGATMADRVAAGPDEVVTVPPAAAAAPSVISLVRPEEDAVPSGSTGGADADRPGIRQANSRSGDRRPGSRSPRPDSVHFASRPEARPAAAAAEHGRKPSAPGSVVGMLALTCLGLSVALIEVARQERRESAARDRRGGTRGRPGATRERS